MSGVMVYSLANHRIEVNYSLPPKEAVRNAYAQFTKKDFNTWDYVKYDGLVEEGELTVSCGEWIAWKNETKPSAEEVKAYLAKVRSKSQSGRV